MRAALAALPTGAPLEDDAPTRFRGAAPEVRTAGPRPQCTAHSVGCPGDARHACGGPHTLKAEPRVEWLAPGPPSSLEGGEGGHFPLGGPTEVSAGCVLESQVLEGWELPPQVPPISTISPHPPGVRTIYGL